MDIPTLYTLPIDRRVSLLPAVKTKIVSAKMFKFSVQEVVAHLANVLNGQHTACKPLSTSYGTLIVRYGLQRKI